MTTHDPNDSAADDVLRRLGRVAREGTTVPVDETTPDGADDALATRIVAAVSTQQRNDTTSTRGRMTPRWLSWSAAAAAVLLVSVVVWRPPASTLSTPTPDYAVDVSGTDRAVRSTTGDASTGGVITRGNRLVVVLRPRHSAPTNVDVTVWRSDGATVRRLALPVQIAPTGAVRIEGVLGRELVLGDGVQRVWVVIATVGRTPVPEQLASITAPTRTEEWFVAPIALDVRAP